MPVRRALLATTLVVLLGTSCAGRQEPGRNLVLITVDTTRADRLGCYGSEEAATPHLDRLARDGVVFERAFTTAPITGPAHASILSGTYPPYHRVRDNDAFAVPEEIPWLPSMLREHGWRTMAVIAAHPLRAGIGFNRGFDSYSDELEAPPGSLIITNLHTVGVASRSGERISDEFRRWLDARSRDPAQFFAWLHYYDPHWPWEPPGTYASLFPTDPYDGEIAYMDECIGTVLHALDEHGLTESTGVVVVGDHGEGLMEHGELTHGLLAYNGTLRVPLILRLPWLEARGRVDDFVSVVDVVPTILEALGVDAGGSPLQGRTLLPLAAASLTEEDPAAKDRTLYFETHYPYLHYRWSPLEGVIAHGRKYIHGPWDEVYDLIADPEERHPIADAEVLADMDERLEKIRANLRVGRAEAVRRAQDHRDLERLRALGYATGAPPAGDLAQDRWSGLPHPADAMNAYFAHNDVLGLIRDDRLAEALHLAVVVARDHPQLKDVRLLQGALQVDLGDLEGADATFAALVRDIPDADVLLQAGGHFLRRGDLDQASDCFEQLLRDDRDDVEALTLLARVAAERGDDRHAEELLERALTADAGHRQARLALAVLRARRGADDAERRFTELAETYPFDPRINHDFGVFLLRRGRSAEGVERLRMAVAMSQGPLADAARLALAGWHLHRGDISRARRVLEETIVSTRDPQALRRAEEQLRALDPSG